MSKTLETYFQDAVVPPGDEASAGAMTDSERAFLEKYMGVDYEKTLAEKGLTRPAVVESVTGPMGEAATGLGHVPDEPEPDIEAALREAAEIQLVIFFVEGQEFAVPIDQVQEVIRAAAATKLPSAPRFIAGIMNLRGRVTPLVDMPALLGLSSGEAENAFTIICRHKGLSLGLMVRRISTMLRAKGEDIEWGVESRIGVGADFLAGLLKVGEKLIKIISVDTLFQKALKS